MSLFQSYSLVCSRILNKFSLNSTSLFTTYCSFECYKIRRFNPLWVVMVVPPKRATKGVFILIVDFQNFGHLSKFLGLFPFLENTLQSA